MHQQWSKFVNDSSVIKLASWLHAKNHNVCTTFKSKKLKLVGVVPGLLWEYNSRRETRTLRINTFWLVINRILGCNDVSGLGHCQ